MTNWKKKIRIKQYFTEKEDHTSVQEAMTKVSNELKNHSEFALTNLCSKLKKIPKGDDVFTPVDYANKLLLKMYDIADEQNIWIE